MFEGTKVKCVNTMNIDGKKRKTWLTSRKKQTKSKKAKSLL